MYIHIKYVYTYMTLKKTLPYSNIFLRKFSELESQEYLCGLIFAS